MSSRDSAERGANALAEAIQIAIATGLPWSSFVALAQIAWNCELAHRRKPPGDRNTK